MERVVLIGNCQVHALTNLYNRFSSKAANQDITYIHSYEEISAEGRKAIEAADILVEHVQDFLPKADIAGIKTKADRIGIPVVGCGFLWPFAGRPHPANPRSPHLEPGPYGSECGDAYLNSLIKKRVDPDIAVAQYAKLDVNAVAKLDRLFEIIIEKQARRDAITGFGIAHLIHDHFRDEAPFLTPHHPNVRISVALATQFFQKMSVEPEEIAVMQRAVRVTPFPKDELPVHPAVAQHFGLRWAPEGRKYRFLGEGGFTFRQFVRRYMLCEWNETLQEGLVLSRGEHLEVAFEKLSAGLIASPQSAEGHGALAHVLQRLERFDAASAAVLRALECNFNHAPFHVQYGQLLQRQGDLVSAEREFRLAAALEPFDPHYPGILANFMNQRGCNEEALAVARHGMVNAPRDVGLHLEAANALDRIGRVAPAEMAYRKITTLAPSDVRPWKALAGSFERRGLIEEAIDALEQARRLQPSDVALRAPLAKLLSSVGRDEEAKLIWGDLLQHQPDDQQTTLKIIEGLGKVGRLADALAAGRKAVNRFPECIELRREFARVLEQSGALEEAIEEIRRAMALAPEDVGLLVWLGDLEVRTGDLVKAQQTFEEAMRRLPTNAHILSQLGSLLSEQGRHDDAVALRRRVVELDPANAHRWAQLCHVLQRAGKWDEAERSIDVAIEKEPAVAEFHIDRARVLSETGRRAAALENARYAISLNTRVLRFHAYFVDLLMQRDEDLDEAEDVLREGLQLFPGDDQMLGRFVSVLIRREKATEAQSVLEVALRLDPKNAWLSEQLRIVSI